MALLVPRDRLIVLVSLAAVTVLAWADLFSLNVGMPGMDMESMPSVAPHLALTIALTIAMWAVMMAGMMLPGAVPMILLFARVQRGNQRRPAVATGAFVSGYLLVWGAFAIVAAGLQVVLWHAAMLSNSLAFVNAPLTAAAFLLAGVYELTPLKRRCLQYCQSPLGFITSHWHPGTVGALRMGVEHGAFCAGCCWAIMLLLFAAGVMNLLWVAALAVLVLIQKLLPNPAISSAITGSVMLMIGLAWLFH
jgi:predicted metal-binding membrane protein